MGKEVTAFLACLTTIQDIVQMDIKDESDCHLGSFDKGTLRICQLISIKSRKPTVILMMLLAPKLNFCAKMFLLALTGGIYYIQPIIMP